MKIKEKLYLNEESQKILTEIAHSFKNQYNMAKEISKRIIDELKLGNKSFEIPLNSESLTKAEIKINFCTSFNCCANVETITNTGEVLINVFINRFETDYNRLERRLYSDIVHELMHGNSIMKHYGGDLSKISVPEYYYKIQNVMANNVSKETYSFCYALYSCYFEEVAAITSEAWPEMEKFLSDYDVSEIDNNLFKNLITQTTSYSIYERNLEICSYISDYKKIRNTISKELFENDFPMSENEILKETKRISRISESAIRNIINNAYIHYLDYLNEKK